MRQDTLAIVVSFNPDIAGLRAVLEAVSTQCEVLIVDNGSENFPELSELVGSLTHPIGLEKLDKNVGLGAAHNIGFAKAREMRKKFALLLDQDSCLDEGSVDELAKAFIAKTSSGERVSAIGSSYRFGSQVDSVFVSFSWLKFSRNEMNVSDSDNCIACDFLISSGTLFGMQSLEAVGDMDESLFIDHVDTEWFLRAHHHGYLCYGSTASKMSHELGSRAHQVRLPGRQRNVPQHLPFRYYYIFRNSILLYRRSYASWMWRWNDVQRLMLIFCFFGFIKPPRLQNLRMILIGVFDGLRGRSGRLDEHI